MWCDYAEVKKKFYPGVEKATTIKDVMELTSSLKDEVYLIEASNGKSFSYEESNRAANRVANSLFNLGLKKGDCVGFFMNNSSRCVFTILGIFKAGMIAVPVNPNFREKEVEHLVKVAEISTIIVDPSDKYFSILKNVAAANGILKNIVIYGSTMLDQKVQSDVFAMDDLLGAAGDHNPEVSLEGEDPCAIFFTSGTTGMPKGAPMTNKIFLLAAQSVLAIPWTNHKSRNYTALPLFHANAQLYSMMGMRCIGTSWVLSERFSPGKFFDEITKYKATYFNSIGGIMQILDAAFENIPVPEHTAEYVFVGGTPKELWKRFEKKFNVTVFEGYSMSEAPVLFLNANPDEAMRKVGSFGIPTFPDLGRRTKIRLENGKDAPEGLDCVGEIMQIGFNMKGYWREEKKTEEVFEDGWLHSGDVARRDEDGYHYFVDRLKFMIRKSGENIAAFEIEDVVNSYPPVAESSVVPVPDPIREEEIKVFVKPVEGEKIDEADLIKFCSQKLSHIKVPRYIEIVKSFPKTATERIQKVELKELEKNRTEHGWDRDKEIPEWRKLYYK